MTNTTSGSPELLTAQDVADRLNVHLNTIYKWARSGDLKRVRAGRAVRFRAEDVDAFLAQDAQ